MILLRRGPPIYDWLHEATPDSRSLDGREECRPWLGSRYSCMGLLFLSGFHLAIFEVEMADSRRNRGYDRLDFYFVRSC